MAKTPLDREAAKLKAEAQDWRSRLAGHTGRIDQAQALLDDIERRRTDRLLAAELGEPGAKEALEADTAEWRRLCDEVFDLRKLGDGMAARLKAAEARLAAIDREEAGIEFAAMCQQRFELGREIEAHVEALVPLLKRMRESGTAAYNLARRAGFSTNSAAWHSTLSGYLMWRLHDVFPMDFPGAIGPHRGLFTEIDAFALQGRPADESAEGAR